MAIEVYVSERGQKARELVGWPEWISGKGHDNRLAYSAKRTRDLPYSGMHTVTTSDRGSHLGHINNHAALCIFREWVRGKLLDKAYYLVPTEDGWDTEECPYQLNAIDLLISNKPIVGLDNALIEAVLEVYGEKQ